MNFDIGLENMQNKLFISEYSLNLILSKNNYFSIHFLDNESRVLNNPTFIKDLLSIKHSSYWTIIK